jgi:hypothetical protein
MGYTAKEIKLCATAQQLEQKGCQRQTHQGHLLALALQFVPLDGRASPNYSVEVRAFVWHQRVDAWKLVTTVWNTWQVL